MRDAWRLAVGTFLATPVAPPSRVGRDVAGRAMLLAPLTSAPAAVGWAALAWGAGRGWVAPLLATALCVTLVTLLSRGMHLDGLADTADGLSASYDRRRALEVMRRGDVGPSGVTALVLTLLVQVAALASLLGPGRTTAAGPTLAVTALVASRLAPAVACRRGVSAARSSGLGHAVAGSVQPIALLVGAGIVTTVSAVAVATLGAPAYAAALVVGAAILASWAVTERATRRLGGITGDVIGAAIEWSLAAGLVTASLLTSLI